MPKSLSLHLGGSTSRLGEQILFEGHAEAEPQFRSDVPTCAQRADPPYDVSCRNPCHSTLAAAPAGSESKSCSKVMPRLSPSSDRMCRLAPKGLIRLTMSHAEILVTPPWRQHQPARRANPVRRSCRG